MMDMHWDTELAQLLNRLSDAQQHLLGLLDKKREYLITRDSVGLASLMPEEQDLCAELQACHERRQELLAEAAAQGLPADSIRSLAGALPANETQGLKQSIDEASKRSRLLRHQSMAQWVAVQRTMLHLSHMIEIIATGGQLQPTYGRGGTSINSGALMDQAV
jgi:hypothetical protein